MQTVIFCGGKGTRMKEETEFKPKPMVEIGGKPILWHIMKIYAHYGHNEFILPLGYKGHMIKDYFLNHRAMTADFTLAAARGDLKFHNDAVDDFHITFADTGVDSFTTERLLKARKYLKGDEFMVTYGDGVSDIDINKLLEFHRKQGTIATVSGVHPYSKYGLVSVDVSTGLATDFKQKPLVAMSNQYVGGGFMVLNKKIFDYLDRAGSNIETAFPRLVAEKQLSVYVHKGFWMAMDTYLEMEELNKIWHQAKPWAVWES